MKDNRKRWRIIEGYRERKGRERRERIAEMEKTEKEAGGEGRGWEEEK